MSKEPLRFWLQMLKLTRFIEADIREKLKRHHGTTLPRFDVMAALARSETGLPMSALSAMMRVSNGNVTGIVDRLAKDGLVTRIAKPQDKRVSLVAMTPKGRSQFDGWAADHESWITAHLSGLSRAEMVAVKHSLMKITEDDK